MSVLVPNQRVMRPSLFFRGWTRVRKGRKTPSRRRSGNTISKGSPEARDSFQRSTTRGSVCGSWTDCQPQPSTSAKVVPVYSYQRRLYQ
jgi:hypothetical protein